MDLELGQQIVSHGQSPKTSIQQSPLLLEFMNVKRSRSIFIEVAKKLNTLARQHVLYLIVRQCYVAEQHGRKTPINGKHEYKST